MRQCAKKSLVRVSVPGIWIPAGDGPLKKGDWEAGRSGYAGIRMPVGVVTISWKGKTAPSLATGAVCSNIPVRGVLQGSGEKEGPKVAKVDQSRFVLRTKLSALPGRPRSIPRAAPWGGYYSDHPQLTDQERETLGG